jgi:hypothetical protein
MSPLTDDPLPRFKDRRDQADLAERIAGYDLRALPEPTSLDVTRLARIARRIGSQPVASHRRQRYLWLSLAAGLLLTSSAVAFAHHLKLLPSWFPLRLSSRPPATNRAIPHASKPRPSLEKSHPSPGAIADQEAPAIPPPVEQKAIETRPDGIESPSPLPEKGAPVRKAMVARPVPMVVNSTSHESTSDPGPVIRAGSPAAPQAPRVVAAVPGQGLTSPLAPPSEAVPAPSPLPATGAPPGRKAQLALNDPVPPAPRAAAEVSKAESPPAEESQGTGAHRYLIQAVRLLRGERQPQRALGLLESHADDLARSPFADETVRLRVEAHIKLNQSAEALRLLDGMALGDGDRFRDLLLERGRLRAEAGRCSESIRDLSLVLDRTSKPPKEALLKRAECRKKLGDAAGAAADQERYQHEWGGDLK